MNLSPTMHASLEKMGYHTATPVQCKAVAPLMEKRDVIVQAPTGTGKTCAFGIPAIEAVECENRHIQTVVLCPTRELAIQTTKVLQQLSADKPGVRVQALYGGEKIDRQIVALRRHPQIVVATPGRMMDHIRRNTAKLARVKLVVMDEADRMLDMGFRDDMKTILDTTPEARQTVLFSATMSPEVRRIATTYQKDAVMIQVKQDTSKLAISQFYTEVKKNGKTPALMHLLGEKKFALSLVFAGTKSMADTLGMELTQGGFRAGVIHGDLRQFQRDQIMDKYRKGQLDVLVATDVAARGIDVNNIDAVINYDIPMDTDSYVHRIGRTGRADKTGEAYTLIYARERNRLQQIMTTTKLTIRPLAIDCPVQSFSERRTEVPAMPYGKPANRAQESQGKYRYSKKPGQEHAYGNHASTTQGGARPAKPKAKSGPTAGKSPFFDARKPKRTSQNSERRTQFKKSS